MKNALIPYNIKLYTVLHANLTDYRVRMRGGGRPAPRRRRGSACWRRGARRAGGAGHWHGAALQDIHGVCAVILVAAVAARRGWLALPR